MTELELTRMQLSECTAAMREAAKVIDACLIYGFCADDLRGAKELLEEARGKKYEWPELAAGPKNDLAALAARASDVTAMPVRIVTKQDYFAFHKAWCERMTAITAAKNSDYTGSSESPFANFERVETLGICKTEVGFLTRMTDKLCRIASFVSAGNLKVKSESVEDTLMDLSNYATLFAGYLRSK